MNAARETRARAVSRLTRRAVSRVARTAQPPAFTLRKMPFDLRRRNGPREFFFFFAAREPLFFGRPAVLAARRDKTHIRSFRTVSPVCGGTPLFFPPFSLFSPAPLPLSLSLLTLSDRGNRDTRKHSRGNLWENISNLFARRTGINLTPL